MNDNSLILFLLINLIVTSINNKKKIQFLLKLKLCGLEQLIDFICLKESSTLKFKQI